MIKEIEVINFLQYIGQGVSKPVLVLGDDFNEYILKNQKIDNNSNIVNYDCMFVNELLAYQIADYLGVPVPEVVIAFVDKQFIDEDPTLRFKYRFEQGKYFASKKLKCIENNLLDNYCQMIKMNKPRISKPWKKFFKDIINKECIPNLLAFDILIGNFDRFGNEGNILVDRSSSIRKIYAIDHGHSFWGPKWDEFKISHLRGVSRTPEYIKEYINHSLNDMSGLGLIFNSLEEYINLEDLSNHSFIDVIYKIESITEEMVDTWLNNIPNEWYIDKTYQVAHYKHFLMQQKALVRHIIQVMADENAFTNYRGGNLEWRNQENIESHTV